MAQYLDALEARIVAILESARGSSGLGADAAARYFPSGRLRRSADNYPLRDARYPGESFDRSYEIEWLASGDDPDPENPRDGQLTERVRLNVNVGFVYGDALAPFVATTGGEVASTAVQHVAKRALSEMRRVARALTLSDIFQAVGDDPEIEDIRAAGDTVVADLGEGRLLGTVPLVAFVCCASASHYDP